MNERLILLVDDEQEVLSELGGFLSAKGYQVEPAHDGEEALRLFNEREPVLVISDFKMPVMNGIELLKSVRKTNGDVHVILMSGAADGRTIVEAMKEQAFDFLIKPIDLKNLLIVIATAIEKTKAGLARKREHLRTAGTSFIAEINHLDDDITILDFSGDLDEIISPHYEAYVRRLVNDRIAKKNLVCFLSKVKYINNIGLNMLIKINDFLKEKGHTLHLCNISQPVDVYLRSIGYLGQFKIDKSLQNAVKRIRSAAS